MLVCEEVEVQRKLLSFSVVMIGFGKTLGVAPRARAPRGSPESTRCGWCGWCGWVWLRKETVCSLHQYGYLPGTSDKLCIKIQRPQV
jgi:hypothetical protein